MKIKILRSQISPMIREKFVYSNQQLVFLCPFQLFRRVAAALPGMEMTEKKPDSILLLRKFIHSYSYKNIHRDGYIQFHRYKIKLIYLLKEGFISHYKTTDV